MMYPQIDPLKPYISDEPTLALRRTRSEKSDAAIHKQATVPTRSKQRAATLRQLREQRDYRADAPTLPELPTQSAGERQPFSHDYIINRLNRGICAAQDAGEYREAIRLQVLQWYMQDGRLSPVTTARKAWLRPAAES